MSNRSINRYIKRVQRTSHKCPFALQYELWKSLKTKRINNFNQSECSLFFTLSQWMIKKKKKQFGSIHICNIFWDKLLLGIMLGKGLTCARFVQRYTLQGHIVSSPQPQCTVQVKQWVIACIQIRKCLMAFPAFIWNKKSSLVTLSQYLH